MSRAFFSHDFLYFLALIAFRAFIVVVFLVLMMRLFGKRQSGQMNVYDLVFIMALSNGVQNAMTEGNGNLTVGLVASGTILLMGRILTALFVRVPKIQQHVIGSPTVLINDGVVVEDHMKRELVSEEELASVLRTHGLQSPAEARMAVLEVDGTISVVPKEHSK